jgi:hypothetical protein
MSTHWFSCSGGPGADSTKSALEHVTTNMCFCIRWDLWVMLIVLLHPGCKTSSHSFYARVGLVWIPIKAHRDTSHQTCAFGFGGICG